MIHKEGVLSKYFIIKVLFIIKPFNMQFLFVVHSTDVLCVVSSTQGTSGEVQQLISVKRTSQRFKTGLYLALGHIVRSFLLVSCYRFLCCQEPNAFNTSFANYIQNALLKTPQCGSRINAFLSKDVFSLVVQVVEGLGIKLIWKKKCNSSRKSRSEQMIC